MKAKATFKLLLAIILIFPFVSLLSQSADTVLVPTIIDGSPVGAINKFIQGDTTATGERNNPNRVYKLERGKYYLLEDRLKTQGFHLNLLGEEDGSTAVHPAVIAMGLRQDGTNDVVFMEHQGDFTMTNVYMLAKTPSGVSIGQGIHIKKDSVTVKIDNCYFEWFMWRALSVQASDTKVYVTNSHFRNLQNPTNQFNGRLMEFSNNPVDTIEIVNNTWFNSNSFVMQSRDNLVKHFRFEHNTLYNTLKWPIQWSYQTNAKISNNIFYNIHSFGEAPSDIPGQDYDGLVFGVVNVDTLPVDLAADASILESQRKIDLKNNLYFFTSEVTNYWAAFDSVAVEPFMNNRTQAMFDNDQAYPFFVEENTLNIDPNFDMGFYSTDSMIAWTTDKRKTNITGRTWHFDPDNDPFLITWPLPETFTYSTSSPAYSGAEGGFPIGNLNYFPDKKTQWESWYVTDVDDDENITPSEYSLEQNYPNPFNPSTTISYTLTKKEKVTLKIYNILGSEITTLVNADQNAGSYKVTLNASNLASGVYFYSLNTSAGTLTKKMLLVK